MDQVVPPLILLVDDYADAVDMYTMYLEDHGFRVVTAANGIEGVARACAERPALILMDVQMPDMMGTQALSLLRAIPALDAVPIVAFTAQAMDGQLIHIRAAGFDDVIVKPCLPEDLATAITQLIAAPRAAQHL